MITAFYHGCWDRAGHFLYSPDGQSFYRNELQPDFPVSTHVLDSGLLPPNLPEIEGRATFAHLNGWTILAFWDRSGDSRGKSNSVFLIKGTLAFAEMVERCKYHFPGVWGRFKFEVTEGFSASA